MPHICGYVCPLLDSQNMSGESQKTIYSTQVSEQRVHRAFIGWDTLLLLEQLVSPVFSPVFDAVLDGLIALQSHCTHFSSEDQQSSLNGHLYPCLGEIQHGQCICCRGNFNTERDLDKYSSDNLYLTSINYCNNETVDTPLRSVCCRVLKII